MNVLLLGWSQRSRFLFIKSHRHLHRHGTFLYGRQTSSKHRWDVRRRSKRLGKFSDLEKRREKSITRSSIFFSPPQHRAVQHYEQAADYFKGEESTSSANKCMLKVAQYAAQLEDYEKAIQIYESVAGSCLDSSLLKYSAKEYFFRAALCHLSVDILNAQHALEKYAQQYPAFQDSREYKLIKVSLAIFLTNSILTISISADSRRTSWRTKHWRLHRHG